MDTNDNSLSIFQTKQKTIDNTDNIEVDSEVQRLAQNVTNLYALFKQMNEVVFEQGLIVDRIDHNIDTALRTTEKGVKHLKKAQEHQKSNCADRVIKCQVTSIIAMGIALVFKYYLLK